MRKWDQSEMGMRGETLEKTKPINVLAGEVAAKVPTVSNVCRAGACCTPLPGKARSA